MDPETMGLLIDRLFAQKLLIGALMAQQDLKTLKGMRAYLSNDEGRLRNLGPDGVRMTERAFAEALQEIDAQIELFDDIRDGLRGERD